MAFNYKSLNQRNIAVDAANVKQVLTFIVDQLEDFFLHWIGCMVQKRVEGIE